MWKRNLKVKQFNNTRTPVPQAVGYWKKLENRRNFFDSLAEQLNVRTPEDWYKISLKDAKKHGAASLLQKYYDNSLIKALCAIYPEHKWDLWKFPVVPKNHWNMKSNQKQLFEYIKKELNVKSYEDWYTIKTQNVTKLGGTGVLAYYGDSLARTLVALYPEHDWQLWRFSQVPRHYWQEEKNRKLYFEWLTSELKIKSMEDWYTITKEDVLKKEGAGGVLVYHRHSLVQALKDLYPNYPWQEWKFKLAIKGFWNIDDNAKAYLRSIADQLGFKHVRDWYNMSFKFLQVNKGSTILKRHTGLIPLLKKHFPEHNWDERLRLSPSKTQVLLFDMVRTMLPQTQVTLDFRTNELLFGLTKQQMELDVYIPEKMLAIEYQGEQHFKSHYFWGSPVDQMKRDQEKRDKCKQYGITLLEIPFWWDLQKDSLIATIQSIRPDMFSSVQVKASPISESQPYAPPRSKHSNMKHIQYAQKWIE